MASLIKNKIISLAIICCVIGCLIAVRRLGMFLENKFIYYPTKEFYYIPTDFGLEYNDVFFNAGDGVKLHGWYVPSRGSKSAILFFHGNAGNISDRIDNVVRLNSDVGVDVFIVDYHGYGKSKGRPDEHALHLDGIAAISKLRQIVGPGKNIIVFGRSLGGAVAVDVASVEKCDAMIIESTFESIPAVASSLIPFVPKSLIRTKFDSLNRIENVSVPKLIIHGERDSLIPFEQGVALFNKAKHPKTFYPIPGADHNDTYLIAGEEYFDKISDFISSVENQS